MRQDQVMSLYLDMESHGVKLWLMGGWGVDALLGRQTRDHNDLDVLIEVKSLERFRQRLHDLKLAFKHVWDEETWWVHDISWSGPEPQPTAFVYAHEDGHEIDTRSST
jgi:lincosamide nucleotidyltransferase A/C/D/E